MASTSPYRRHPLNEPFAYKDLDAFFALGLLGGSRRPGEEPANIDE
jgi:hypothetical protein